MFLRVQKVLGTGRMPYRAWCRHDVTCHRTMLGLFTSIIAFDEVVNSTEEHDARNKRKDYCSKYRYGRKVMDFYCCPPWKSKKQKKIIKANTSLCRLEGMSTIPQTHRPHCKPLQTTHHDCRCHKSESANKTSLLWSNPPPPPGTHVLLTFTYNGKHLDI